MCRSEMCRIRSGAAPAGSTGSVACRSVQRRTSMPAAYVVAAAVNAAAPATARPIRFTPASLVRLPDCRALVFTAMTKLKDRLRADLSTAIKSRSTITVATLRMALSAITTEEVAGAAARELSDQEVLAVLTREAKKRREAAEAFDDVAGQIGKPPGFGQLGLVMKAAMARAAGRAEGRRVSTAVMAALQG